MDRDPSMGCFVDYNLQNIVSEILDQSGVNIEVDNNSKYTSTIPYVARYKESSYSFLARILNSFGEWFYYDGSKLIVGNSGITTTSKAMYDMELNEVEITSDIRTLNTEIYDYDPLKNEYFNDVPSFVEGSNNYMRIARNCSEKFYPHIGILSATHGIVDENDVINHMKAIYSRKYSQMSRFKAVSDTYVIRLGEMVITTVPKSFKGITVTDLGRYRVTEIFHTMDENDIYKNTFWGVPGGTEVIMPDPNIQPPVAYPEPAIVVDNKDPDKLGRVKV
ncbi:MAG: hypothetical protein LUH15_06430 [Tannerellaceae bacterium]|nr:hypothetical protein [Tannerellaceae bacterium]